MEGMPWPFAPRTLWGMAWQQPSFHTMYQVVGKGARSIAASSIEENHKGRTSSFCRRQEERSPHPLSVTLILTAEMSPWDHCPSSTALAGMAPTCKEGEEE